jgi:hypothetical protein
MAAVLDVTKTEISTQLAILDSAVKTWWDSADAYDASFGSSELFIKLATAAYMAQVAKNTAANTATPLVAGEALAAYSAPVNGIPVLNVASGLQVYTQTVSVSGLTATDSNATAPARL